MLSEWCLYCCGFWVGMMFSVLGYGWLGNIGMDGMFLVGVTWVASEASNFSEVLWYGFMERGQDPGERK